VVSEPAFAAFRFDGVHADALPVLLSVEQGHLVVAAADGTVLERQHLERVGISEPFRHAPRWIALPGGATLEVPERDGEFARALRDAGVETSPSVRLREWPAAVAIALAVLVAALAGAYVKGVPAAARWVAFALGPRLEARMGQELLSVLDQHYFRSSRLDPRRRQRIAARFARGAAATAPGVRYRLEFRAGRAHAVNAVALPGGIIVLLDGLVDFAVEEDAVLGVLGHELGHVVHKHTARQIFQSVGVGAAGGLLWGDFAGSAASAPVALGMLRYSREFEREADDFAVAFVRNQKLSASAVSSFFRRVRQREMSRGDSFPGFLSTHPSTDERIERFRRELR
jgi:predicted Zn-dependent protease